MSVRTLALSLALLSAWAHDVAALAADATPASYGRYPCTQYDDEGMPIPDDSACDTIFPSPGVKIGSCVLDPYARAYFCGIEGAKCDSGPSREGADTMPGSVTCDGGDAACSYGRCLGGPGRRPTEHPVYYNFEVGCEEDTCGPCLGHLELGLDDICGGTGAGCTGGGLYTAADSFCAPDHSCDAGTGKCVRRKGSQSRPKRPIISACPASQTLCSLGNRSACVDTESDVEHCGGCAGRGGLDCTSLPGATDVDCVWGRCEIWECAPGWEYSEEGEACVRIR